MIDTDVLCEMITQLGRQAVYASRSPRQKSFQKPYVESLFDGDKILPPRLAKCLSNRVFDDSEIALEFASESARCVNPVGSSPDLGTGCGWQ